MDRERKHRQTGIAAPTPISSKTLPSGRWLRQIPSVVPMVRLFLAFVCYMSFCTCNQINFNQDTCLCVLLMHHSSPSWTRNVTKADNWHLPEPGPLITHPLQNNNTETSAHPDYFFSIRKSLLQVGYTCRRQKSNSENALQGPPV